MKHALAGLFFCGILTLATCSTASPAAPSTGRAFAERIPDAPGLDNFARITPTLYRGAHPSADGLRTLKERGVKTVVCLRSRHSDKKQVEALGMKCVELPLQADLFGSGPPAEEQIRLFFETILDPPRQPVYFHCAQGKDRTGTMAALYRIEIDGWTPEEAIEEMQAFGYHDIYKDLIHFVKTYKPRGYRPSAFQGKPPAWKPVKSGTEQILRGVFFGDATHAWTVGDAGTILFSKDGGQTWTAQKSESTGTLRGVHFVDAQNGWIVGDGDPDAPPAVGHIVSTRPRQCSTVLATADGGTTWTRSWAPTNFELHAIWMVNRNVGQICNHGGANHADGDRMLTADGGQTWTHERVYRALNACFWVDEKHAWAVGSCRRVGFMPAPDQEELYTSRNARIVVTTDGGVTWKTQASPEMERTLELRSVGFADASHGVVCGDAGTLHITADAGATWSSVAGGTTANLNAVVFGASKIGWIAGDQGTILETRDGGKTWKAAGSGTTQSLYGIHSADKGKIALAVGAGGTILRLKP